MGVSFFQVGLPQHSWFSLGFSFAPPDPSAGRQELAASKAELAKLKAGGQDVVQRYEAGVWGGGGGLEGLEGLEGGGVGGYRSLEGTGVWGGFGGYQVFVSRRRAINYSSVLTEGKNEIAPSKGCQTVVG